MAFQRWVYQRVYCPRSKFGGDFTLAPAGTIRRYRRRYFSGRADTQAVEWVAKLRVEEGPAVRTWITRSGEGMDALASYLVDGRSGFTFFDSMEIGNRAVTCQSLEPYLPGSAIEATSWTGSGCWLTDSVSGGVYPHAYRSVLADLFLPGSQVAWRYQVLPASAPVKVRAGEFSGALVRRSKPYGWSSQEAEFEEVFARGAGRIRSAGYEEGRLIWVEELESVSFPTRPRDSEPFCSEVE
ncbi:MAG: hypothetical protein HYT87_15560 [Nitrospirae bacterium]|nr:hypothetical protein [Nitrospirota bacterium]